MPKLEVIDDKLQAVREVIHDENIDIYVLSLDEKYDEPYVERLSENPLGVMSYLIKNENIFFVKKIN